MNSEQNINKSEQQSSDKKVNGLFKKIGRAYGRLINFEDSLLADDGSGLLINFVNLMAKGTGIISGGVAKIIGVAPAADKKAVKPAETKKAVPAKKVVK